MLNEPVVYNKLILPLSIALYALNALGIISLFCFMAQREVIKAQQAKFWTSFNIQLLAMGLSSAMIYAAVIWLMIYPSSNQRNVEAVMSFFGASWQIAFVLYSWGRGKSVISLNSPSLVQGMELAMKTAPFIIALQVIPRIIAAIANSLENTELFQIMVPIQIGTAILGGIVAVALDFVYLITFVRFIWRVSALGDVVDDHLLKVSQFGTCSTVCAICALAFLVMGVLRDLLYTVAACGLTTAIFFVLFGMKYRLHRLELTKETNAQSQIDEARKEGIINIETGGKRPDFLQSAKNLSSSRQSGSLPSHMGSTSHHTQNNINIYTKEIEDMMA
ncbi:hypothetical protein BDR26DRAFT_867653 [Obelidium mucronatum]|nr:hypothetical protein BDR26DRAFT_867653 [Obelidium mucronatum]